MGRLNTQKTVAYWTRGVVADTGSSKEVVVVVYVRDDKHWRNGRAKST